ncbi:hypothetical protein CP369_09145 [Lactobacillus sp. UMNPBX18]|nr:hypothetical protein CP369_09145 [Lactobacillus sp. UMNPBX18]
MLNKKLIGLLALKIMLGVLFFCFYKGMWFTENKRQSDRRLLMKKILAINHEFVARSYILFPMLLFAFSIIVNANIITFGWIIE